METVTRKNNGGRPSKLQDWQKDKIVQNYNHGDTQKYLAEEYAVSITTIRNVLRERTATK